ncbi:MAG: phosphate acyltransferase [Phycisphaerae bacterium]|nr:MAG: phosphate acyltransferase PlsX [Planctomycetia bacterium]RIK69656.1 MAG: phosphate acyltransferase PlsX [Planctomycetota bacterium]GJQ25889.1 MAG: phosphate acyltransferase [Phycisphaerae bacterium]
MRIAIDAMGGDHAPAEIVRGAVEGLSYLGPGDELILLGKEDLVRAHLGNDASNKQIAIQHCPEVIEMDDSPVEALRQKKNSSIMIMAKLASERAVDAVISAGNTGACAAACQLKMRTLAGLQRPGIAVVLPSFHGPLTVCDVGANVAPKPHHLLQYAQMASAYAEAVLKIKGPRVGLLSIGSEEVKGSPLVKQTHELLKQDPSVNFVGNIEGRELFNGACEVAVCDGFVGNVVLKLVEGLSHGIFETIKHEIEQEDAELAHRFEPVVKKIWARHDYSEYGGAPLLGVDGVCIICHGSSDRRAIKNAVRVSVDYVKSGVNEMILSRLTEEVANA